MAMPPTKRRYSRSIVIRFQPAKRVDNRHWEVSNAEQLAMSDGVGMINLSHFIFMLLVDAEALMEYLSVAKVGADGTREGVCTHFLDHAGGIRSDLTIIRPVDDCFRVVCGGDTGHRDYIWMRDMAHKKGFAGVTFHDRSEQLATSVCGTRVEARRKFNG